MYGLTWVKDQGLKDVDILIRTDDNKTGAP